MIISNKHQSIFLMIPKTGSQSACETIKKYCSFDYSSVSHENMEYVTKKFNAQFNLDPSLLQGYTVYAFYRDPIDRFISSSVYLKRRFVGQMTNLFYDRFTHRKASNFVVESGDYDQLPESLRKEIEQIPIDDIIKIESVCNPETGFLIFKKQVHWLNCPNIIPLNYHDYNNELKRLVEAFGGIVTDDQIAKINTSVRYNTDVVNQETQQKIRELYHEDYAYFDKMGIQQFKLP